MTILIYCFLVDDMLRLWNMSVITFAIQRLALGVLAAMTFLGLVTEEAYFATENSFIIPQERKEEIVKSLADPETVIVFKDLDSDQDLDTTLTKPEVVLKKIGLQDEITEVLRQNTPKEAEDIFILPANVLRKEAEIKGITIPDQLTEKPVDREVFNEKQREDLQKTLSLIEDRLDKLKIEQSQRIESPTQALPPSEVEIVEIETKETPIQSVSIPSTRVNAVINIVCLEKRGNILSITVGSGVFISDQGTIITNGHVAQHILKQESEFVDCEVKHPQNPTMRYRVAVLHIPDIWRGGGLLNESQGTGENDFAFLKIVGPAPNGVIPQSFPFIPIQASDSVLVVGNDILLSGYPARTTGDVTSDTNVPLISDESTIEKVFTFEDDSIDIISSGASSVAKRGSSGGAIINNGSLIGIIVTTNTSESGGTHINGLTLNYIQRELKNQGLSLNSFI